MCQCTSCPSWLIKKASCINIRTLVRDKKYLDESRSFEVKILKQNYADSRFTSETVRENNAALSLYTPCPVSPVD